MARGGQRSFPGRGWLGAILSATLLVGVGCLPATALAANQTSRAAGLPPPIPAECAWPGSAIAYANQLLANRYWFYPHPTVTLPADPTWGEDPLHDVNWQFQFQSLRFVDALLQAWTLTGDATYRHRAVFLLKDWILDNPRHGAPSAYSWNDHATALRAAVLACAAKVLGMSSWLRATLQLHGNTLADPNFYVYASNHALNQNIGLLDVGFVLGRPDWMDLARSRLAKLVVRSVDSDGATNEQSVFYEYYNYRQYTAAAARLLEYGLTVPHGFSRVEAMPDFLAFATLPNGDYEMIGDTKLRHAVAIPGTIAEFAATQGSSGPMPSKTVALYGSAGWLFARTGWGTKRPFADEVAYTLRFGPKPIFHGHLDGGSLTLYGYGASLLIDPGEYTFNRGSWRTYFTGRSAHDVVTVNGLAFAPTATTLLAYHQSARAVDTTVATDGYSGVHSQRRVVSSRKLGYVLVEDRLSSDQQHTYRQLWHLPEDADPQVDGATVETTRPRGNLMIRQLKGGSTKIVSGSSHPIQGWVSYHYGVKLAAPVAEVTKTGTSVRYLTLLVPAAATASATVSDLILTPGGFSVRITIGAHSELVTVTSAGSSITDG
jgi:hypothetical protein